VFGVYCATGIGYTAVLSVTWVDTWSRLAMSGCCILVDPSSRLHYIACLSTDSRKLTTLTAPGDSWQLTVTSWLWQMTWNNTHLRLTPQWLLAASAPSSDRESHDGTYRRLAGMTWACSTLVASQLRTCRVCDMSKFIEFVCDCSFRPEKSTGFGPFSRLDSVMEFSV